jgi:SAM-dependent methyltransferase
MKSILKKVIGPEGRKQLRGVQAWARASYYSLGNDVECPICHRKASKFLPFNRPNALCYQCRSLERHRLVYLFLKNKTKFFESEIDVLHFAPEKCLHDAIRQHPNIHYKTADLMTTFIDTIGVMPDYVMSVTDIKFAEATFDVVICNHVFELVPDATQGMNEIYRVLKPGGYAIIQAAVNNKIDKTIETQSLTAEERKRIAGAHQHVRRYGRDYAQHLQASGFEVEISSFVKELDHQRYGLMPDEDVYVCHKKLN